MKVSCLPGKSNVVADALSRIRAMDDYQIIGTVKGTQIKEEVRAETEMNREEVVEWNVTHHC